jgi:hypothetical protein
MSVYYPQAAVSLRVRWEDFGDKDAKLLEVYKLDVIPKRVSVNINDYTTADTFELEIDYKSFPFDPRAIRSCGVSIFIEDMGKLYGQDNALRQIRPSSDLTNGNVIFQGFADEESINFDDDKRVVKLEGRDFTGILIDAKYLAGTPIDMGQPLDVLVGSLLAALPATKDLKVDNRTGKTLPTLKQFYPGFGAPLAGQRNVGRDDTYWEIIQDLAAHAGVIVYVEIDKLVISTPRVLYDKSRAKQFIYGSNLKTVEFKRKLGRHKGFNVIVRCLDTSTKQVLQAKIPEEGTDAWAKDSGIPNKQVIVPVVGVNAQPQANQNQPAPYMAFRVTGINDKPQLVEVGQKIFEELSRQQVEGSFETHEMEVMDKKGECFDLTKLRIGVPVAVEIDSTDLYNISRFGKVDQRRQFLIARGYPAAFADTFAKVMGGYTPVFYTKAAAFTLDSENGFKLKVDFLNFIDLDNKGINFG